MKLSIAVPTYNKADYLNRLLDTLLRQDFAADDFEVIVVNDGSTDHTESVIAHYQLLFSHFHVVNQEHQGIGAARNAGIRAARGELIAFVADDYLLAETYCSCLVAAFENERVIGIRADLDSVGASAVEKVWLNQIRLGIWYGLHGQHAHLSRYFSRVKLELPNEITAFQGDTGWCGGCMMRRWIFELYGLYREDLETGEDTEMSRRLARHGLRLHFYPKRLLSVAFRSGYAESLKRAYQYSVNGRAIIRMGYRGTSGNKSFWQKSCSFGRKSLELLYMADNTAEAMRMLPYLFLNRLVTLWVFLRD